MNKLFFDGYGYYKTEETALNRALDGLMETIQHECLEFIFERIEIQKYDDKKNELFFEGFGFFKTSESEINNSIDKLMDVLQDKNIDFTIIKTTLCDQNENIIEEINPF